MTPASPPVTEAPSATSAIDERAGRLRRRAEWAVAAVLLALHGALAWTMRVPSVGVGNDDAVYVQLARSLRDFTYRDSYYLGAPAHVKYPPGYPALLALVSAFGGERVDVWLAMGILMSVAALALLFDVVRRRLSPGVALIALGALALNPELARFAGAIMSEAPFLFFLALSLWALSRDSRGPGWLSLAGAAAIAAALTRSIGIVLVGAILVLWIAERRWRAAAAFAVVSMVTVGAWIARTLAPPEGTRGEAYLSDTFLYAQAAAQRQELVVVRMARRIWYHATDYLTQLIPSQLPVPTVAGTLLDNVALLGVVLVFGGIGAWVLWRRWREAALVLAAYAALLLVWPWVLGRFITPVLPLLVVMLVAGAERAGQAISPRRRLLLPAMLAALIVAAALPRDARAVASSGDCDRSAPTQSPGCFGESQREYLEVARRAAASTPDSAVFVVAKEGVFGYYAGRRTVPFIRVMRVDSARVLDFARAAGATHIALTRVRAPERRLAAMLAPRCGELALVATVAPAAHIFRVLPAGVVAGDGAACRALAGYLAVVPESSWSRELGRLLNGGP